MPLLHIVSSTPFNRTFTIGYCFLQKEEVGDYVWALQSLKSALGDYSPSVVSYDRERALISAVQDVFPSANLCKLK
jgi:hypothetical protein